MTGNEHYREAERLIDQANSWTDRFPSDQYAQTIAEAQVHAILALAAGVNTPEDEPETDYACTTCGGRIGVFQGTPGWQHFTGQGSAASPYELYYPGHEATFAAGPDTPGGTA